MRIVPLLIFWSLPLFHTGGQSQLHFRDAGVIARLDGCVNSLVIERATGGSVPGDPGTGNQGASFEDEEDTLEDGFVGACVFDCWRWQDAEPANLSHVANMRHGLLRIPAPPHPLRC